MAAEHDNFVLLVGTPHLSDDVVAGELRRRVHVTDLDRVEIVTAELGTWAGAMGAAVHGAEAAIAAGQASAEVTA